MSHTTKGKVNVTVKNNASTEALLKNVARRLDAEFLPWGKHKLYSTTETGFGIHLKGWTYPIVINESGLALDNYKGAWGSNESLSAFKNRLTAEHVKSEMRKQGYTALEQTNKDGSIKITAEIGG